MPNENESSEGPLASETEKKSKPCSPPAQPSREYQQDVERMGAAWHSRYE